MIRNTKKKKNPKQSECYLDLINKNLPDPSKFWKLVKSSVRSMPPPAAPDLLKVNDEEMKGKQNIADAFNKHFIDVSGITSSGLPVDAKDNMAIPSSCKRNHFNFLPISASQLRKALSSLDSKKSSGPDQIELF